MSDIQARRLIEMMHHTPAAPRLEVCLPPFPVKQSTLDNLSKGDILSLPIRKMETLLLDEQNRIVAHALYGMLDETPSIFIESETKNPDKHIDSKKYKKLKILLGEVTTAAIDKGKVVPLDRSGNYDVVLYRGTKYFASAHLVRYGHHMALCIEEVL